MYAYCLVDFFNLDLWPSGRKVGFNDIRDGIDDLILAALNAGARAKEITFRLYGGWHGEVPESRVTLRDLTGSVIGQVALRNGNVRLRFQLAEAPVWDPSLRLLGTVRQFSHQRLSTSIDHNHKCPLGPETNCALPALKAWAAGKCPNEGCSVRLEDVASGYRQKMVDTLMTADALAIGREGLADTIMIASDDADLLPALLMLKDEKLRVVHMTRKGGHAEYYRGILERDGVTTHQW